MSKFPKQRNFIFFVLDTFWYIRLELTSLLIFLSKTILSLMLYSVHDFLFTNFNFPITSTDKKKITFPAKENLVSETKCSTIEWSPIHAGQKGGICSLYRQKVCGSKHRAEFFRPCHSLISWQSWDWASTSVNINFDF